MNIFSAVFLAILISLFQINLSVAQGQTNSSDQMQKLAMNASLSETDDVASKLVMGIASIQDQTGPQIPVRDASWKKYLNLRNVVYYGLPFSVVGLYSLNKMGVGWAQALVKNLAKGSIKLQKGTVRLLPKTLVRVLTSKITWLVSAGVSVGSSASLYLYLSISEQPDVMDTDDIEKILNEDPDLDRELDDSIEEFMNMQDIDSEKHGMLKDILMEEVTRIATSAKFKREKMVPLNLVDVMEKRGVITKRRANLTNKVIAMGDQGAKQPSREEHLAANIDTIAGTAAILDSAIHNPNVSERNKAKASELLKLADKTLQNVEDNFAEI